MFNVADYITPLIRAKLTELKIPSAITDQVIAFTEPQLKNIDITKFPAQALNFKTHIHSFLDKQSEKIGADKVALIKTGVDQVIDKVMSGDLPTGVDVLPGTDLDKEILGNINKAVNISNILGGK